MKQFVLTLGELSRKAGIAPATARHYTDAGLVDCLYTSRGDRLFFEAAVEQARSVRESRVRRAAEGAA